MADRPWLRRPLPTVLVLAALIVLLVQFEKPLRRWLSSRALEVSGAARVIDGDTLDVAGRRVRLLGVDAPESRQMCERKGDAYACGREATRHLQEMIAGRAVTCQGREEDRYGRLVGNCFVDGEDIGADLVRAGWALAYRQYSTAYVPQEREARRRKAGMWSGKFDIPSEWRRENRTN